jgi:hypothetical protein
MSVKRLVPLNTTELSSDPDTGRAGDLYYNSSLQELRVYTGSEWKPVSGDTEVGLLIHQHTYDGDIYSVQGITTSATFVDGGSPALTGVAPLNIVDGGAP